jgi:XapX domain-containing protein
MIGYLVSLAMGLVVGVAYGLVQVRSPAPPLIALIGLLGMVLGEQAIEMAKRHVSPFPLASVEQPAAMPTGATSPGGRLCARKFTFRGAARNKSRLFSIPRASAGRLGLRVTLRASLKGFSPCPHSPTDNASRSADED